MVIVSFSIRNTLYDHVKIIFLNIFTILKKVIFSHNTINISNIILILFFTCDSNLCKKSKYFYFFICDSIVHLYVDNTKIDIFYDYVDRYFSELCASRGLEIPAMHKPYNNCVPELNDKFTLSEIESAISHLKGGKSAGDDHIISEFLSCGKNELKHVLVLLKC